MDDTLLTDYTLPEHKSAMDWIVFLPYTFKELKEVDLVEFSAMYAFGIAPYITLLQRNVVPLDLFYWGLFNCDASDERLIITGLNGSATVVGWQELERAFGANHSEDDEFRATKIMQKQLLPYNPNDFLLVFTEKNSNEELVSGKDYEENAYYHEAAPYGPTYYLMTHPGRAPVLVHLLYTFRERLFPNSPLASIDHWAQWRLTTHSGDLTFSSLSAKFKNPIADIDKIRELCKFKELEDVPDATEATAHGKKPVSCRGPATYRNLVKG
ncbi:hypothetical protein R1sor_019836 [Riccia sorocarpa]|uniref:Uncharacterized protein n=1 Tax=Riccia sorocarpa TaxID=122646 RepID=A0ABD3IFB3_9MARC